MNLKKKLSSLIVVALLVFNMNIVPIENYSTDINSEIVILQSVEEWDSEW